MIECAKAYIVWLNLLFFPELFHLKNYNYLHWSSFIFSLYIYFYLEWQIPQNTAINVFSIITSYTYTFSVSLSSTLYHFRIIQCIRLINGPKTIFTSNSTLRNPTCHFILISFWTMLKNENSFLMHNSKNCGTVNNNFLLFQLLDLK